MIWENLRNFIFPIKLYFVALDTNKILTFSGTFCRRHTNTCTFQRGH